MDDGSWALAVSLGHVRNAVVAFVAAEDPSGASLFFCRANSDITKPGVQKPHCEPWHSTMACCTLCSWP